MNKHVTAADAAIADAVDNGLSVLAERIETLDIEMADKRARILELKSDLLIDAEKRAALCQRMKAKMED